MKISRRSWHYRFMCNFLLVNDPKSLCSYFWHLIFVLLFSPIIIPFIGVILFTAKIADKFKSKDNRETTQQPGLIRSYYRAVKNKVCPLIEYE